MTRTQQGFTLIELMIVVAIIGILAAVALPAYKQYTVKTRFAEVIAATGGLKSGVEVCAQTGSCLTAGAIAGIAAGAGDIPAIPAANNHVASVAITATGTITATATSNNGLGGQTYILIPTLTAGGQVTWDTVTGTCYTGTPKIC
ncbi:prepilin-type N-terminal cleavage/methylation domain-containing protein [Undibacterium sp. LX15W]|uniref:Prepilin-type N-terminal cleavage/methylation domain-containing protein n=2 Tax=Undibacterium flavidum TaxID=2762297 RepID=A0ABR6Y6Y4_9BURK|nr:prepilin-type N-terminal cleavage/methylation domain-containing protein [Undibacterium flavidum]